MTQHIMRKAGLLGLFNPMTFLLLSSITVMAVVPDLNRIPSFSTKPTAFQTVLSYIGISYTITFSDNYCNGYF